MNNIEKARELFERLEGNNGPGAVGEIAKRSFLIRQRLADSVC
jgi:hypothetical protein